MIHLFVTSFILNLGCSEESSQVTINSGDYVLDDFYNLYLKMDVSISDVILTIRLKNGLYKFFEEDDYSPVNHELFNPVSSLLSFGIIWEFDD